jgi:hypothetical protein
MDLNRSAFWVAAGFALMALYLAFFVTPPGDIPDESVHFSYARDIARGDFFPLLGEATMAPDLWGRPREHWSTEPRDNWIAQHPPLYYLIAAGPLAVGELFSETHPVVYRLPRIASALSLGALIFVLYRLFSVGGVKPPRALLLAASTGFVPMVMQLASGTNNDIFLFLLSALASYYWVRFLQDQQLRHAYLFALWLTLAGATKMTAWVFMAPMVAILLFEMRRPPWAWLGHAVGVTAVALSFPILWMSRNLLHFGAPFYVYAEGAPSQQIQDDGFLQFMREQPVLDSIFAHFYGLFGFSGYCQTPDLAQYCDGIRMTRLGDFPYHAFTDIMALMVLAYLVFLGMVFWQLRRAPGNQTSAATAGDGLPRSLQMHLQVLLGRPAVVNGLFVFGLLVGLGASLALYQNNFSRPGMAGTTQSLMMSVAPLAALLAGIGVLFSGAVRERLALYGAVLFFFFGSVLLYQVYAGYLDAGWLRGVQGRYFYPVLPLMLLALGLALERLRVPTLLWLLVTGVLALAFLDAFVTQVIPFYLSVRI